ncbi:unnamed protein product [Rhizoctonia solani]|uniref:Uncharacterized protein n=1 Tax=Rhizoctonia solani TaxID=456999 RepID=A0A8H2WI57_9AGAM|nr:unnamed protein product [Rhizoctonia solani]
MSSYTGTDPGRLSPRINRLDYASPHHSALPFDVDYAPSSGFSHAYVPNFGLPNTPVHPDQPNDVSSGFSETNMSTILRSRLKRSGLYNLRDLSDSSSVPRNALGISPVPIPVYAGLPSSRSAGLSFGAAVNEDYIATKRIITGAPPAQRRSRLLHRPTPIFSSGLRSPAPAPSNPGPSQRVFAFPIPTFDIAPTIELPPSRDSSLGNITHSDEGPSEEIEGSFRGIHGWPFRYTEPASPNHSNWSDLDQVSRVSPLQVRYPSAIARHTPSWAYTEDSVVASYDRSVVSRLDYHSFRANTSGGSLNDYSFPMMSTPYNRTPLSFSHDDPSIQSSVEPPVASAGGPLISYVLQYPNEEHIPVHEAPPVVTLQGLANYQFTFNFARTGTLSPHPPRYMWPEPYNRSASASPSGVAPPDPRITGLDLAEHFASSYDSNSAESSASCDEIIGNRPEESPFGPAIRPDMGSPSNTKQPTRRVRVVPFAYTRSPPGARTGSVSAAATESDTWFDKTRPSTPSPPTRFPLAQSPPPNGAYSYQTDSTSPVVVTRENMLPPLGNPEDPDQVTLPSFAQLLEALDQARTSVVSGLEVDQSKESVQVNGVAQASEQGEGLEYEDEGSKSEYYAQGSDSGHEGDDEDENDDDGTVEKYISAEEHQLLDIGYAQSAQPFVPQSLTLVASGIKSSPHHFETEGSAYSDDGYVHYSTDSDATSFPCGH